MVEADAVVLLATIQKLTVVVLAESADDIYQPVEQQKDKHRNNVEPITSLLIMRLVSCKAISL